MCPDCLWVELRDAPSMLFTVAKNRDGFKVAVSCPSCGYYWWTTDRWTQERWSLLDELQNKRADVGGMHLWGGWDSRVADALRRRLRGLDDARVGAA
jgi:hypothetical protein